MKQHLRCCSCGLVVGLLLAYLVAMQPSGTGEHYYFEIMLPGSILGAVVGWATQAVWQGARARGCRLKSHRRIDPGRGRLTTNETGRCLTINVKRRTCHG